jgi:prepilin-type N-terminal cleavage/methylation domain-containing protein
MEVRCRNRAPAVGSKEVTRPRPHAQSGLSLVELLVAVALIGIAFVALVGGLGTFFAISTSQRATADIDAVVRMYVEHVTAPQTPYAPCGSSYTMSLPAGYSFSAGPTVSYWAGDNPSTFTSSCATHNANGVQKVTATIRRAPTRDVTVVITKRNLA